MFGLGFSEILIILVLALILLGPKRLPDVAKQLGRGLRDFKKATDDLKQQFESELYAEESRTAPRPTLVPPTSAVAQQPQTMPPVPAPTAENVPGPVAALAESPKPAESTASPSADTIPHDPA